MIAPKILKSAKSIKYTAKADNKPIYVKKGTNINTL